MSIRNETNQFSLNTQGVEMQFHSNNRIYISIWNHALTLAGFFFLTVCLAPAQTGMFISDNYDRVGSGEVVVANKSAASGTATTNSYSGLVEIIASGVAKSWPASSPNTEDPFYQVTPNPGTFDSAYYQLNFGSVTLPFRGGGANNVARYIVFIDGIGPVSATRPPYDAANHTYHFVMSLPDKSPTLIWFGDSDGQYSDNTGSYTVEIHQIAPAVQRPTILVSGGNFGFRSNAFGFNVAGKNGSFFVVEASSNLAQWTALTTNTLDPSTYFSEPTSSNLPSRFYRLRMDP